MRGNAGRHRRPGRRRDLVDESRGAGAGARRRSTRSTPLGVEAGIDALEVLQRAHKEARRRRAARATARPARSRAPAASAIACRVARVPALERRAPARQRSPAAPARCRRGAPVDHRDRGREAEDAPVRRRGRTRLGTGPRRHQATRQSAGQPARAPMPQRRAERSPAAAPSISSWRTIAAAAGAEGQAHARSRCRRADARASSRLATLAQAMSSTSADHRHQHAAAAGGRSRAGSSSRFRRARARRVELGHRLSRCEPASAARSPRPRSAARRAFEPAPSLRRRTPGAGRARTRSQKLPGSSSGAAVGLTCGSAATGMVMSATAPTLAPTKPRGLTPTIGHGTPLMRSVRPIASGLRPNWRCQ